ncbi:hypothetical protein ACN47E_003609 [Coniothyrium glycines]
MQNAPSQVAWDDPGSCCLPARPVCAVGRVLHDSSVPSPSCNLLPAPIPLLVAGTITSRSGILSARTCSLRHSLT